MVLPLLLIALLVLAPAAQAKPLDRPDDPVVLTGAATPSLVGATPTAVVAFAWEGRWKQIRVQVDERKSFDLRLAYPNPFSCAGNGLCYPPFSTAPKLRYADPGTLVGADTDPKLDADDELVFMAKDAGSAAAAAADPATVVAGSRVQVKVRDPLDGGVGYVYLFKQKGKLDPGVGAAYVTYAFNLASGSYPATYKFAAGTNTESSTVVTRYYSRRFSDRWQESELKITRGGASGADILDRAENQFAPDVCGRSRLTFSRGEGAFLINRTGPVRAIRSFLGANSGPMTESQQIFYRAREDDSVFLRVHPIPSVMSFLDYSPAAGGMTYRNNNNTGGVTIDGAPDTVAPGVLSWESVDGAQGGLTSVHTWDTDVAASKFTSFYRDLASPPAGQAPCEGDGGFYGASGPYLNGSIADTNEPADGSAPANRLTTSRTMFFDAPGAANGALRQRQVATPLATKVTAGSPKLRLGLRLRYRHSGCGRRSASVTVAGAGLGQIRRVGLLVGKRTVATDRRRPFRLKLTAERLHGHHRIEVAVRLKSGKRLSLKAAIRALC
ncbi:MAG: hypothetical protein QOE60_2343 [Thermoleophilaceae bacterium]|nr:hypothetical protein [Thermoleophilaceae bacterium]